MQKWLRYWGWLAIILFLACENDLKEVQKVMDQEAIQYETAKTVELLYSDSAIVRVRLQAPIMVRQLDPSNPRSEFPEGIKVDFYDEYQRAGSYLTSKYAERYSETQLVAVRDSVVWQSKGGDRLETEELYWDERQRKVYTKKFVRNTKPDEIIYGYGFEGEQDFTKWKILAITGRIKVEGLPASEAN